LKVVAVAVAFWAVSTAIVFLVARRRAARMRPPGPAPRTWDELRRRVLDEDYLTVADMEERRRKARQIKYGVWLFPVLLIGTIPVFLDGSSALWVPVAVLALGAYGAINAYRLGRRFERRWEELIATKRSQPE
jgi:hypothetical protein